MKKTNYWFAFALVLLLTIFNIFTIDSAARIGRSTETMYFSVLGVITISYFVFLIIRSSKLQENMLYSIVAFCVVALECIFVLITNSTSIDYHRLYKEGGNIFFRNGYLLITIILLSVSTIMIIVSIIFKCIVQNERIVLYMEREKEKKEMIKQLENLKHELEMEKLNKEYENLKALTKK